jgi:Fic/DOC family
MAADKAAWTLQQYIAFLSQCSIERAYRELGYDYAAENEFQKSGSYCEERVRFLKRFQWHHEPQGADIKRIFNQTNTFYAENWAASNVFVSPKECIFRVIQLTLFGQGRSTEFRTKHIAYGARVDLDTFDPRRHFNLLRGIAPRLLDDAVRCWIETVDHTLPRDDAALYLALAFVAIHPFVDGNGRLARVVYTWLLRRWSLPVRWFAEAGDGEFFRVGFGIDSTEYLMGQFILGLCGGYNRVKHGFGEGYSDAEETQALNSLRGHLSVLTQEATYSEPNFAALLGHMLRNHHFRTESPRFECLKVILQS